jgi:FkbM family methyltransferase
MGIIHCKKSNKMNIFELIIYQINRLKIILKSLLRNGSFSFQKLDKKMEKYINYKNGFFVEIGANDGITQSNTLYYERKYNWRGILIEPSPNNYLLCKQYRGKQNKIFCNACVGFDYKRKYVDMVYSNLMTISQGLELNLESRDKHLETSKYHLKEHEDIFEYGAVAATLTKILTISNASNLMDFLSLDVEGAEMEVLKGLDFSTYNFKYILVEHYNFDILSDFMKDKGYKFVEKLSYHDYLFKYDK